MNFKVSNNKIYVKHNISENPSIFEGYLENYEIPVDILIRLSKDLGFSYDVYNTVSKVDKNSANSIVKSMSNKIKHPEVIFLVDQNNNSIIDYTLDSDRYPVLNSDFLSRVCSLADTSDAIEVSEYYYHESDKLSYVILKKSSPITIEEKYLAKESNYNDYNIGVMIVNDETSTTYCRLVLYVDNQPLYLPASYYNSASSRYKRSTSSSLEAIEVLVLKVIDDLREDAMLSKVQDIHYRYRANRSVLASYEEYNMLLRTMRKIPSIIEDNSFLESLVSRYEEFEKKYAHVDDQKSSYIWRCTAISDFTIGALISITSTILNDLGAPPVEYTSIRELLGSYISTNRIVEEIAKEDIYTV